MPHTAPAPDSASDTVSVTGSNLVVGSCLSFERVSPRLYSAGTVTAILALITASAEQPVQPWAPGVGEEGRNVPSARARGLALPAAHSQRPGWKPSEPGSPLSPRDLPGGLISIYRHVTHTASTIT